MTARIGIDLGTTYSVIAHIDSTGRPEIITNRDGERLTPSVVLFQGSSPSVGTSAKRAAPSAPYDCVQFVKRQIGDSSWRHTTPEGESFTAEQVSAIILRRLIDDAEIFLGEKISEVVITVPAYFDDARRQATIDAGTIAGINVKRVINEPTAAAIAFGINTQIDEGTILVYDLGGGTFDVSLMNISGDIFEVIATDGDRNLGGFDWDNELMNWVNDAILEAGGPDLLDDDAMAAELRDKAELAKRTLSTMEKTKIFISASGINHQITVTRDDFEKMTVSLLRRTGEMVRALLSDPVLPRFKLDRVLLVGGSTRMPAVIGLVEGITNLKAEKGLNPDEIVAAGAAIQAHLLALESEEKFEEDFESTLPQLEGRCINTPIILDVVSQGLGVVIEGNDGPYNDILILRNSRIPSKHKSTYYTVTDNQTQLNIQITQGNDKEVEYVTIVGTSSLPIPAYPSGSPVEVTLSFDVDGIIHVEVRDLVSKQSLGEFEVDRVENLSRQDVDEMTNSLSGVEIL